MIYSTKNNDTNEEPFFDIKALDATISKFIDFIKAKDAPKVYDRLNFRDGYLKNQEDYKRRIQERAKSNLSWNEWQVSDIGSGVISEIFLNAINPKIEKENNLVDNRFTLPSFRRKLNTPELQSTVEKALFDIYTSEGEEKEQEAFIKATREFGRNYDLIAFLFFLKDPQRFLPVRPTFFDQSFKFLNLLFDYKMAGNCSWSNYNTYLNIIHYLKEQLSERLLGVSLLDAHSFAWIVRQGEFRKWINNTSEFSIDSISVKEFELEAAKHTVTLKGWQTTVSQRTQKERINSIIGDEGERFVLQYETEIVKSYNIKKVPERKSQTEGDGLGYDILSYDKNGNEVYIEVKTTTGKADSTIYITANELEKSKIAGNSYRLYRVYNFDINACKGDIQIKQGSLEDLCISAQKYIVNFKQ